MINKEKLLNGYVKTDNKELVRLFLMECLKHDEINLPIVSRRTFTEWERFAVADTGTPCGHNRKSTNEKEELTLDDFKTNPKNRFSIGDKVKLDGLGGVYSSYSVMAKRMNLSGYSYDRFPKINEELTIIAEDVHPDFNLRLLGVRDLDGYEYVIGENGLSMIEKAKSRTKTTYEPVTDMTSNEIAKAMIDGEVFYSKSGVYRYVWDGECFVSDIGVRIHLIGKFYRKVEKEIDWKDEAVRFVSENETEAIEYTWNVDGIELSDKSFIKLCHLVAELTDKPE